MSIPVIYGQPIHIWFGILLFLMLVFQVLVGRKLLHVPFKWHRVMGYIILTFAFIHGLVGLGLNFGYLTIG